MCGAMRPEVAGLGTNDQCNSPQATQKSAPGRTCSQPRAGGEGMSPSACCENSAAARVKGRSDGGTLHSSTAFTGAAIRNL